MCHTAFSVKALTMKSILVTTPDPTAAPQLPQYGADIPAALQQLPELLQGVQQHEVLPEDHEPNLIPNDGPNEVPQPKALQPPKPIQESEPINQFPVNIAPSRQTWTG